MTKKDFEFIANVLFKAQPIDGTERHRQWTKTVNDFSEALAQENPRFHLGKFEKAATTDTHIRSSIKADHITT